MTDLLDEVRLAHDVAISAFGSRQTLYERFFFGPHAIMAGIYYDLYDKDAVTITPEVPLGVFDLEPGTVPLTVEITDANPAATKAWMFGLDYLRFVPVKDPSPAAK